MDTIRAIAPICITRNRPFPQVIIRYPQLILAQRAYFPTKNVASTRVIHSLAQRTIRVEKNFNEVQTTPQTQRSDRVQDQEGKVTVKVRAPGGDYDVDVNY